jgi:hypothetical protein
LIKFGNKINLKLYKVHQQLLEEKRDEEKKWHLKVLAGGERKNFLYFGEFSGRKAVENSVK